DGAQPPCLVPAGVWNIRVSVDAYVPEYWWSHRIPAGEAHELGRLTLREGASLLGRVESAVSGLDLTRTSARLTPAYDHNAVAPTRSLEMAADMALVGSINEWGYFRFAGLRAGAYRLDLEQPGYAAISSRIDIRESEEHVL